jgi:hypothetical protein
MSGGLNLASIRILHHFEAAFEQQMMASGPAVGNPVQYILFNDHRVKVRTPRPLSLDEYQAEIDRQ